MQDITKDLMGDYRALQALRKQQRGGAGAPSRHHPLARHQHTGSQGSMLSMSSMPAPLPAGPAPGGGGGGLAADAQQQQQQQQQQQPMGLGGGPPPLHRATMPGSLQVRSRSCRLQALASPCCALSKGPHGLATPVSPGISTAAYDASTSLAW